MIGKKTFLQKKVRGPPQTPPEKSTRTFLEKSKNKKTLFDPLKVIQSIFFIKWTPPKPAKILPNTQIQLDLTNFKVSFDNFLKIHKESGVFNGIFSDSDKKSKMAVKI